MGRVSFASSYVSVAALSVTCCLASPSSTKAQIETLWFASAGAGDLVDWSNVDPAVDRLNFLRASYVLSRLSQLADSDTSPGTDPRYGLTTYDVASFSHNFDLKNLGITLRDVVTGNPVDPVIGDSAISTWNTNARVLTVDIPSRNARVIAFRGSENFMNWMTDFNAATIQAGEGSYHYGFYLEASQVFSYVLTIAQDHCSATDGKPLYLTGHSLGGVTANIVALWLAAWGCHIDGVVTYGAPRPGDQNLAVTYSEMDNLGQRTHSWRNVNDPIPCLPFGSVWGPVGRQHLLGVSDPAVGLIIDDTSNPNFCGDYGSDPSATSWATETARVWQLFTTDISLDSVARAIEQHICNVKPGWRVLLDVITGGAFESCYATAATLNYISVAHQFEEVTLIELTSVLTDGTIEAGHQTIPNYVRPLAADAANFAGYCFPVWNARTAEIGDSGCGP